MGLLVATLVAGGALAAPGGNGKGLAQAKGHAKDPSGQGNGVALANGHEKHAPATPQLTSPPAEQDSPGGQSATKPSPGKRRARKPSAAVAAKANHVTICHATGSGRYIVISPSAKGVDRGHFRHHDDFLYNGSCSRGESPSPGPDPDPEPPAPPTTGAHPPLDPKGGVAADVAARPSGSLPFTGVPALAIGLLGGVLVAAGWFLARRSPT